jgi:hypothetical protein
MGSKRITEYTIVGPLHVNHQAPGSIIDAKDLTDADYLVSIGWLEPVVSGTSSSTMQKQSKLSSEEKV